MSDRLSVQRKPAKPRRRITLRTLGVGAAAVVVLAFGLWVAIHEIPWLGPALADGVRSVVGPAPVAWAEDLAYGWQDRVNRWRHGKDAPHTYWEVPGNFVPIASASPPPIGSVAPAASVAPAFPPVPVAPPLRAVAAPGDGVWVPVVGRAQVDGVPAMVKTMVHPDHERPYTVLALVAMDVSRVRIHAAAGTIEPRDRTFPESMRSGTVPPDQLTVLIAAFNGGFQTIHGGYGMMVDGHPIGEPRTDACTVGLYRDGSIRIRSWPVLQGEVDRMKAYRQTPRCLVENGERHPELENRYNTSWGAVVDGGTVIRRSALGISADGKTLFFGMGDSLTARSLADGMKAAGAHDVAQLDVNHVFPRFVFFGEVSGGGLEAVAPLCPGFSFSPGDYVQSPMARDFFYVTSAASR